MRETTGLAVLQLFAEGGGADGGAGVTAADAGQQTGDDGAQVYYGKPAPGAQAAAAQNGPQDREADKRADFEELIKGEYKTEFDERVQKILSGRLKSANEKTARLDRLEPALKVIGQIYGVDPSDADALLDAVATIGDKLANEALDKGMDPKDYARMKRQEAEISMLNERLSSFEAQAQADQDVRRWIGEAEALKSEFPNFDLQAAMQNDEFKKMLMQGIGVRTAYIAANNGEILPAVMRDAAANARKKTVEAIRSGMARPTENGRGNAAPATFKTDPSTWTDADFKNVEKQVMGGKKIYL